MYAGGGDCAGRGPEAGLSREHRGYCSEGGGLIRTILTKQGWLTRAVSCEAGSYCRIISPRHGLSRALPLPAPQPCTVMTGRREGHHFLPQ